MKTKNFNSMKLGEHNTVPVLDFERATQKWQFVSDENEGMIDNVILPNFFDIPMSDLVNLVEELGQQGPNKAISVRAYIGTEEYPEDPNLAEMKLYFTGVNSNNQPILTTPQGASKIYDFVTPCPPTCEGGGGIPG